MSALVVSNATIDVIVGAAAQYRLHGASTEQDRPSTASELRELGRTLWIENQISVNDLYVQGDPASQYRLHTTEARLDPVAIAKALDCYEYQSCEHSGWESSEAAGWVRRLRDVLRGRYSAMFVPTRVQWSSEWQPHYRTTAAYDAVPWGFTDLAEAHLSVKSAFAISYPQYPR